MKIFKLTSLWALALAGIAYLLQVFPFTGIFLMMLGGPFWPGLFLHIFLIALLVEAATGRVWRILAAVPLLAYGCYYAIYLQQQAVIDAKMAELRATNPGQVLEFDPARFSLVQARDVQGISPSQYAIPVVYIRREDIKPQGYQAITLVRKDQCNFPKDNQARVQTYGVHGPGPGGTLVFKRNLCGLRYPEAPKNTIVEIVHSGTTLTQLMHGEYGGEDRAELRVDGRPKAIFRTAYMRRLSSFPWLIAGCTLIDSAPAWKCFVHMSQTLVRMNGYQVGGFGREENFTPAEAIMLGLHRYTADELDHFQGAAENMPRIAAAAAVKDQVTGDFFSTLNRIIAGQDAEIPFGMDYAVGQQPQRLAPLADAIVDRFDAMTREDEEAINRCTIARDMPLKGGVMGRRMDYDCLHALPKYEHRIQDLEILSDALAALPPQDFARVGPRAYTAMIRASRDVRTPLERHMRLYIRSGDLGAAGFARFKQDFLQNHTIPASREAPLMAICRSGIRDPQVVATLIGDLDTVQNYYPYRQLIGVTLLKLGREDVVRQNIDSFEHRKRDWIETILSGKGWTKAGPNNCAETRGIDSTGGLNVQLQERLVLGDGWNLKWHERPNLP